MVSAVPSQYSSEASRDDATAPLTAKKGSFGAMKTPESNLPWVEKYRPNRLEDVIAQEEIVRTIRRYVEKEQLPHLLFHGPPGTGKTSTILAVAKEIYGSSMQTHVLELNASDDRGINTVREQIKTFAETTSASFHRSRLPFASSSRVNVAEKNEDSYASQTASLKLIILDEADQMTSAAQNALRRIMEAYARNVRFCLICNYLNRITPAIQSRCTSFRFVPVAPAALKKRAEAIALDEGIKLSPNGLEALTRIAVGDMRRLLNCMQASHMAHPTEEITADLVHRTLGLPVPSEISSIFKLLLSASFSTSCKEFEALVTSKGYSLKDFVGAFHEKVLRIDWPVNVLISFISRLADIEGRLTLGASEVMQVHAIVAAFFEARAGLQHFASASRTSISPPSGTSTF